MVNKIVRVGSKIKRDLFQSIIISADKMSVDRIHIKAGCFRFR